MELSRASIPSTHKTARAFIALLCLGAASMGCRVASAQEPRLEGVFLNRSSSDEPIRAAIDEAAKEFNFITRPIARSRLKKTNPLVARIEIHHSGNAVSIQLDKSKPTLTEPGKPPIKWTRDDGEVFDVTTKWESNALLHAFVAPDGQRINRYSVSPDGSTLFLDVTLTSPQLKNPVKYRLALARSTAP